MKLERYWLCWSFRQACSHIESEAEGLRANIQAFQEDRAVDYVPIGVFPSYEAARDGARRLRAEFERREHERRARKESR